MGAKLTAAACRAGRAILKWSVRDLADKADISPTTVQQLQAGGTFRQGTADAIVRAFEQMGVQITNGDGTGARLLTGSAFLENARRLRDQFLTEIAALERLELDSVQDQARRAALSAHRANLAAQERAIEIYVAAELAS